VHPSPLKAAAELYARYPIIPKTPLNHYNGRV
jgi:hypothetical protein